MPYVSCLFPSSLNSFLDQFDLQFEIVVGLVAEVGHTLLSFSFSFGYETINIISKMTVMITTLLTAVMIVILFYQNWVLLIGWIGAVEAVGSEHEQKAVSCEHSRKE